jgi:hypothetical protein
MGVYTETKTVTIPLPAADVLMTLQDIADQREWWPGMFKSEPLETDGEGRVTKARIGNDAKVAKDEFDVAYEHGDLGYSWTLASKSTMQRSQDGSWRLKDNGDSTTDVTLTLAIDVSLPLPGFIVKKTVKDAVNGATKGLQKYLGG